MSDLHDIDSCESAVEDIADGIQKSPEREKRDINRGGRYAEGIFGSKSEQFPKQKHLHRVKRVEKRELRDPSRPSGFFTQAFKPEFGDRHISEKQKEGPGGGCAGHEDQRKGGDLGIHAERPSEAQFQKAEQNDHGREQSRRHIEHVQQNTE